MGKKKIVKTIIVLLSCICMVLAGCGSTESMTSDTAGLAGDTGYEVDAYTDDGTYDAETEVSEETKSSVSEENLDEREYSSYEQKLIKTVYMSVETTEFDELIESFSRRILVTLVVS